MALQPRQPLRDLLSVSFNQDAQCFAVGVANGFRVHTSEPCAESCRREFENGGVSVAEMLFRSNIFALVGGGQVPRWAPTKVIIWDEHQGRAIGELACKTPIKAVRMRRDRIAVALEQKVLLYDLDDLRVVHQTETAPNPEGLLALSTAADSTVLACPGLHAGEVRVDLLDTRRVKIIAAHDSPLAALALSPNGKLLATASERGTIIRVFSSADGTKLKEFRRGSDPAKIYCLAFSRGDTTEWLAATSDKGTAHVFSLQPGGGGASGSGSGALQSAGSGDSGITGSSPSRAAAGLAMLSKYMPASSSSYLSSERAWAKYRLPDSHKCMVAFGKEPYTLLLASVTGAFHKVVYDPQAKTENCDTVAYTLFMDNEDFPGE